MSDKKNNSNNVSLYEEEIAREEKIYYASQWQLIWWKFRRHRLAIIGGIVLFLLYISAIFCEFLSPYSPTTRFEGYQNASPTKIHIFEDGKFQRPFIYGFKKELNMKTFQWEFKEDKTKKYYVKIFAKGEPYRLWGIFKTDRHLLVVDEHPLFLFGADNMGRCLFSRSLYGARISLSIGLVGVFLSFSLGTIIGGISGYFGGTVDIIIQRIIEFLSSIPTIPLWMALSAALPKDWPVIRLYFAITIILSIIGWTGLARVVRGKLLALREEDFTMAARLAGASEWRIITKHLLPSFTSHLIVSITLSIPGMILGETALSFLGLGMQPPAVSWGVLLQDAQNIAAVALYPWKLLPSVFVILTVLAFNFLGDGLRDAADPYAR
ncbi:MAG: ABC transporter permease [bacterium]|nr:ABC transporter permease [bacterium]